MGHYGQVSAHGTIDSFCGRDRVLSDATTGELFMLHAAVVVSIFIPSQEALAKPCESQSKRDIIVGRGLVGSRHWWGLEGKMG